MKRRLTIIAALIACLGGTGIAQAGQVQIEIKGAYFQPSDSTFKDVYGAGPEFGAEIGYHIGGRMYIWAGGSLFSKKGKLTFSEEGTKIQIIPIIGGVKFEFTAASIAPYVGAGIGYFKFKEETPIGNVDSGGLGYLGQGGVLIHFGGSLFADLQVSYTYCRVKPVDIKVDIGGLHAGIGLGYKF